mgnify:CR=1 FL=1
MVICRWISKKGALTKMRNKKIREYIFEGKLDITNIMKDFAGYVFIIIKNSKYNFNNEDIEEIASDVFLVIWQNQKKLDINKEIKPYIAGITKNLILKKQRMITNQNLDIEILEKSIQDNTDIYNKTEENEKTRIIMEELDKMKEEDKNIFMSYYYFSKKIKDISKELKISEIKVKSRLSRIRKKLKKELEKRGYGYERK